MTMGTRATALAITLFLAAISGCGTPPENPAEAAAISSIQKLGGKVEFDGSGPDRRVFKVYLHNTAVQDADLSLLEQLPKLKNLFLGKTQIGDAGLAHLRNSEELQTLSLNSTGVTDEGLKSLSKLVKLKTLNVMETQVTAEGTAILRQTLPNLNVAR